MSSPSDNASKQAQANEAARQAAIAATQARVNQVFNSPQRAADIQNFVDSTRQFYTQDLNQQKANNDRQLKFALARGGQIGSSTQVDQQTQFGKDYTKGVLAVDQKARGEGAQLEAADQQSRAQLIALATSGLDATTAAQQAAASQRSSLANQKSDALTSGIGDVFGQFSKFYQDTKDAASKRKAQNALYSMYGPLTPPAPATGGGYG